MVEATAGAAAAGSGSGAAGMSGASWVPTAINSGTGLVGSLAGMFYNAWAQNRQNEWNAQQMRLQNQWNIDQWNRENAYNTPLRQMMRLQAAGINPALAYSNGQLMNEAASSPAMEASQGVAPQVDASIFSRLAGLSQQQKLIDSQANKNNAEAKVMLSKLPKEMVILDETISNIKASTNNLNTATEVLFEDKNLRHEEARQKMLENSFLSRTLEDRVKDWQNKRVISDAEADYARRNCEWQLKNLKAAYAYTNSLKDLTDEQKELCKKQEHQMEYHINQFYDSLKGYYDANTGYIKTKTGYVPVEVFSGAIRDASVAVKEGVEMYMTLVPNKPTKIGGFGKK